jgi:1-acyl-sn-glycerol-3-phosphate acyltransferase
MGVSWHSEDAADAVRISPWGWVRVGLRGVPLAVLVFGGLLLLLMLRLLERPLFGLRRPLTPFITQFVCRNALRILGLRFERFGTPMQQRGAFVANHASWLDIFTLNAGKRIYFVSKDEVADWPGIGWLARATGTLFIERKPQQARQQAELFAHRLLADQQLMFFPEGTSTDGLRVLPFKPTLFAAFFSDALRQNLHVQPVTVQYHAPRNEPPRFYGWWGDMDFGPHLLKILSAQPQGRVQLTYHPPVKVADFPDRKALAAAVETTVRRGHQQQEEQRPHEVMQAKS